MSFVTVFIKVIKHGAIFGQDNQQTQLFPDPWSYLWPFLQKYVGSLLGLWFREQLIPRTAAKRGDLLSPFPFSCCPLLALQSHLPHIASSHTSRTFPGEDLMWHLAGRLVCWSDGCQHPQKIGGGHVEPGGRRGGGGEGAGSPILEGPSCRMHPKSSLFP